MATIFGKIKELESAILLSKHEQLINGILNSIDDKILVQGSVLPSVKIMSKELGFASETRVGAWWNQEKEWATILSMRIPCK